MTDAVYGCAVRLAEHPSTPLLREIGVSLVVALTVLDQQFFYARGRNERQGQLA